MKVLLISTQIFPVPPVNFGYGGLEVVVYDLAEELGKRGHDVYVLGPSGSHGEHFKVITPTAPSFANPEDAAYTAIKPALRDFDIIHDHSWQGYVYLAKRENPKLRVLHTIHAQRPYSSLPVPKPNFVVASEWHQSYLARELGFETCVVYHGIDLSRYPYKEEKGEYLLFLARVAPYKGALNFVRFCRDVGMPGVLAGEDLFIEDPEHYVRQVMEACDGEDVTYIGRVAGEQKVSLLQNARVLISPLQEPYYEIFGLSTIEAMSCGTPVLSTDRGAARNLITQGLSGAVAQDMSCMQDNLKVALGCRAEDCRNQAELFSREKMACAYEKLYEEILDGAEW